jgi:hypothetical protein
VADNINKLADAINDTAHAEAIFGGTPQLRNAPAQQAARLPAVGSEALCRNGWLVTTRANTSKGDLTIQ